MSASGDNATTAPLDEEVKPYRIRVSGKYQDLTRQKLELTRLPHEISTPKSKDWWEPKSQVEPLIDFWLEQFSWRDQENEFNASLPQFRTSIKTSFNPETSVRVHFIHSQSPHANAVPLLLIPPFPFTNLSLGHLVKDLTDPDNARNTQPFHVVIPSLPGVGFGDALPNNTPMISTTTEMLDILMKRLEYPQYIATNTGAASTSPAGIDWKLGQHLSSSYQDSCLGFHFIAPPLASPKFKESPMEWSKWTAAKLLKTPMMGYSKDDFSALQRNPRKANVKTSSVTTSPTGLDHELKFEPNTLAYALCDSPTGLLLFVMKVLRVLGAKKELTQKEMITLTALMWLPGPEAMLRFWAYGASHDETSKNKSTTRPKVSLTVFLGDEASADGTQKNESQTSPRPTSITYGCPTWAKRQYNVVDTNRVTGNPGLIAWERPEIITNGAQGLAKAILAVDKRMQKSELPGIALLEQVVVEGGRVALADLSGTTVQSDAMVNQHGKKNGDIAHVLGADSLAPPKRSNKRVSIESARSITLPRANQGEGSQTDTPKGGES